MSAEDYGAQPAHGGGPSGPIREHTSARELEYHNLLEEFLSRGEPADLQVLRDYSHSFEHDVYREKPIFSLAWPKSWYIPGDADYLKYWVTPPPAANRYRFGWHHSDLFPDPNALIGDASTGHVFAYTALLPSDTRDSAFAGVGVLFRPSATFSYADVSIDADVVAHSRIWTLLAHPTANLPTVHIRCTAYACVWKIDPVTGAWELVRPYGSKSLFNRSDSGLSGSPIQTVNAHYSGNALSTRVQVEAGRSYAVGFQAQVDIDVNVRDINNQPYQRRADDDWKLWGDLDCSVAQITIDTTVLVP